MRQVRIYVAGEPLVSGVRHVSGQAARHILKVLRMKPGDALTLFDGHGGEYPATILGNQGSGVELQVAQQLGISRESPLHTCIAVALPKGERMDLIVQKASELGVSQIVPLHTARTIVRLSGTRAQRRQAHWLSVAASACEQCGRNQLPEISAAEDFLSMISRLGPIAEGEHRLIPDPSHGKPLAQTSKAAKAVTLLIGPEGGFTTQELDAATSAGFQKIRLGPRILRTETAAISLLSALQWAWGDLAS